MRGASVGTCASASSSAACVPKDGPDLSQAYFCMGVVRLMLWLMLPLMLPLVVSLGVPQHELLMPEGQSKPTKLKEEPEAEPPIPLMSLAQINRYYETGTPSNNLSGHTPAGLVVHMQDNTEEYGPGHMFQPGTFQFQEFWPTSIVSVRMPGLYTYDCGLIVNPDAAAVMCSSDHDASSWNFGCKQANLFPPDKLEAMLNSSLQKQQNGRPKFE